MYLLASIFDSTVRGDDGGPKMEKARVPEWFCGAVLSSYAPFLPPSPSQITLGCYLSKNEHNKGLSPWEFSVVC